VRIDSEDLRPRWTGTTLLLDDRSFDAKFAAPPSDRRAMVGVDVAGVGMSTDIAIQLALPGVDLPAWVEEWRNGRLETASWGVAESAELVLSCNYWDYLATRAGCLERGRLLERAEIVGPTEGWLIGLTIFDRARDFMEAHPSTLSIREWVGARWIR
jgi:hypothetical protein